MDAAAPAPAASAPLQAVTLSGENGSTSLDHLTASSASVAAAAAGKKRARESRSNASPAAPPAAATASSTTMNGSTSNAASTQAPHADSLAHIDLVVYAGYEIRPQYPSPYPLDELPGTSAAAAAAGANGATGAASAANQTRENGGRFGKKVAAGAGSTSQAAPRLPQSAGGRGRKEASPRNDSQDSLAPNSLAEPDNQQQLEPAGPPARVISPELAVPPPALPAAAAAAAPAAADPVPMQIDSISDLLPTASVPNVAAPPARGASPELAIPTEAANPAMSVSIAETPTPSPSDHIPLSSLSFPRPASSPSAESAMVNGSSAPFDATASTSSAPLVTSTSASTPASQSLSEGAPTLGSNIPTSRGNRGRFLPKPPGETVKAKRAAERAARLASSTTQSSSAPYLTQRQQRELARKAREEREREVREKQKLEPPSEVRLFVCDRCFKYMGLAAAYLAHQKECQTTKPPGRRVYQRGATSIWEIDGAQAKLYCQNLCLFAKLFIEHKYMFFDVESFTFYLLTEAMGKQEWVLGYFSKEKISYDDYNLACIVVFPPFRQRGWATLLIEFSYELSRRFSATPGTPERPLSELGQRGYLAFWISVLVRYFRAVFALRDRPPLIDEVISATDPSRASLSMSPAKNSQADDHDEAEAAERERKKRLRRSKGWDGELPAGGRSTLAKSPAKAFTLRPLPPVDGPYAATAGGTPGAGGPSNGGTASVELVDGEEVFSFVTGLEELAHAVNMRPDDVAYALVESGLARWRYPNQGEGQLGTTGTDAAAAGGANGSGGEIIKMEEEGEPSPISAASTPAPTVTGAPSRAIGGGEESSHMERELELVITPELVEEVARQKAVKPMPMLDVAYVCDL
ncbi:hypothetical protein JCM10908_006959 [Rhodotorula pacifica]|uniref:uncharacterized protein n=1 Tax=Rhodotorula pacifica TaxID=1495444 RepID=UPI00316C21F8